MESYLRMTSTPEAYTPPVDNSTPKEKLQFLLKVALLGIRASLAFFVGIGLAEGVGLGVGVGVGEAVVPNTVTAPFVPVTLTELPLGLEAVIPEILTDREPREAVELMANRMEAN